MLRTVLQITGLARALADLKYRLEARAERAVSQVKGIAVRIAIAAALAIAAVIFTLLALITGLIVLYAYLEPTYGAIPTLAIVGVSLVVVALVCVLTASLVARGKSKRESSVEVVELDNADEEDWRRERRSTERARPVARREAREVDAIDSLVSLASTAQRRERRAFEDRVSVDAMSLLQSGDRRTMLAVLSAVAAVGWLMGRTMPRAARR